MPAQHNSILITDKVHDLLPSKLRSMGYDVEYDTNITLEKLPNIIHRYIGIVINSKIVMDRKLIDLGAELKFIARLGSGLEIIDVDYAKQKGIAVINSPEGNKNAVGEHALGMLLCLANKLHICDRNVKNFVWEREKMRGFELAGKTIGIIGFGHMGSSFAEKLSSMRLKIISYDKYKPHFNKIFSYVEKVDLDDILKRADIISLHLPLTPETKKFVDGDFISRCKEGVILINTSRGSVIDTAALIKGLESGKVGGACLDVFENEKVLTYTTHENEMYTRLYEMDNVVLSPHVAGWTSESLEKIAKITFKKVKKALE